MRGQERTKTKTKTTTKESVRGQERTKTKTKTKESVRGQEGRNSGRSLAGSKVSAENSHRARASTSDVGYNPIPVKGVLAKKGKFSKRNTGKLTWALSHNNVIFVASATKGAHCET